MIYFYLNLMNVKSLAFLALFLLCQVVYCSKKKNIPVEGPDDPPQSSNPPGPCNVIPEDCPALCTKIKGHIDGLQFPTPEPGTLEKPVVNITYNCKDPSFQKGEEFFALQIRYTLKLKEGSTFPNDRRKTWYYDKKTRKRILYEPKNESNKRDILNTKREELNTKREDLNAKREDLNTKREDLNDKREALNDKREALNNKRANLFKKQENKPEEKQEKTQNKKQKDKQGDKKEDNQEGKQEDKQKKKQKDKQGGKKEDTQQDKQEDKQEDKQDKKQKGNQKKKQKAKQEVKQEETQEDKQEDNQEDIQDDKQENKEGDKQEDLYKSNCISFPEECPSLCRNTNTVKGLKFPTIDFPEFLIKPVEFNSYICKDPSFQEGEFYALQTVYTLKLQKGSIFSKQKRKTWYYDKERKHVIFYEPKNLDNEAQTEIAKQDDCKSFPEDCPSLCTETNAVSDLKYPSPTFPAILAKPAKYITYICKDPNFLEREFYALQIQYSKITTALVPRRGPTTQEVKKILYYNKESKEIISYEPKNFDKSDCKSFPDNCPSLCKGTENVPELKFPTPTFPAVLEKAAEYTTYICKDPSFQEGEFYALQIRYTRIVGVIIPPRNPPPVEVKKAWYYDKESKQVLLYEPKSKEVINDARCPVFPENCPLLCKRINIIIGLKYPTVDFPEFLEKPEEHATYLCKDPSFQEDEFYALQTRYTLKPKGPNGSTVSKELKKTWYYDIFNKQALLYDHSSSSRTMHTNIKAPILFPLLIFYFF